MGHWTKHTKTNKASTGNGLSTGILVFVNGMLAAGTKLGINTAMRASPSMGILCACLCMFVCQQKKRLGFLISRVGINNSEWALVGVQWAES